MSDPGIATRQVPDEVLEQAKELFGMEHDELEKALEDPWNLLVLLDICRQKT